MCSSDLEYENGIQSVEINDLDSAKQIAKSSRLCYYILDLELDLICWDSDEDAMERINDTVKYR